MYIVIMWMFQCHNNFSALQPSFDGFFDLWSHPEASNFVWLFPNNGLGNYGYHSPEVLMALFPNYYALISRLYSTDIHAALFLGWNVLITEILSLLQPQNIYQFNDLSCIDIQDSCDLIRRRREHVLKVFGDKWGSTLLSYPVTDIQWNLSASYVELKMLLEKYNKTLSDYDYISMHGVSDYLDYEDITRLLNLIASKDKPMFISIRQVKVSNSRLTTYNNHNRLLNDILMQDADYKILDSYGIPFDLASYIKHCLYGTWVDVDIFLNDQIPEEILSKVCCNRLRVLEGNHDYANEKRYYLRQLDCLIRRLPRIRKAWVECLWKVLLWSEKSAYLNSIAKGWTGLYFSTIKGRSVDDLISKNLHAYDNASNTYLSFLVFMMMARWYRLTSLDFRGTVSEAGLIYDDITNYMTVFKREDLVGENEY